MVSFNDYLDNSALELNWLFYFTRKEVATISICARHNYFMNHNKDYPQFQNFKCRATKVSLVTKVLQFWFPFFSFEIWHVLSKVYDKGGLKISKQGEGESLV